ncbi:MAG: superoxide dismutase family protein [Cyclobacteriaceae bacterium]
MKMMMKVTINSSKIFLFASLLFLLACGDDDSGVDRIKSPDATAQITGMLKMSDTTYSVNATPYGEVLLYDEDSLIRMVINLTNFNPNTTHAIHVHNGSCEQPGMHWNQNKPMTERFCGTLSLGIPWAKPFAGDVGNVSVDYQGNGSVTIKTNLWSIGTNDDSDLINRSIVVHETLSDFNGECDPMHDHVHTHANPKIACGMILLNQE